MIPVPPPGYEPVYEPVNTDDGFMEDAGFLGFRKEGTDDKPVTADRAWRIWSRETGIPLPEDQD